MSELRVAELEQLCHDHNLSCEHKGNGHYHVVRPDGLIVNYWPFSKRLTAHISGTPHGLTGCQPKDVVRITQQGKYDGHI